MLRLYCITYCITEAASCELNCAVAGGLGDVMAALPKAMVRRGHRVMVVAPRYEDYPNAWETGVRRTYSVFNTEQEVCTARSTCKQPVSRTCCAGCNLALT